MVAVLESSHKKFRPKDDGWPPPPASAPARRAAARRGGGHLSALSLGARRGRGAAAACAVADRRRPRPLPPPGRDLLTTVDLSFAERVSDAGPAALLLPAVPRLARVPPRGPAPAHGRGACWPPCRARRLVGLAVDGLRGGAAAAPAAKKGKKKAAAAAGAAAGDALAALSALVASPAGLDVRVACPGCGRLNAGKLVRCHGRGRGQRCTTPSCACAWCDPVDAIRCGLCGDRFCTACFDEHEDDCEGYDADWPTEFTDDEGNRIDDEVCHCVWFGGAIVDGWASSHVSSLFPPTLPSPETHKHTRRSAQSIAGAALIIRNEAAGYTSVFFDPLSKCLAVRQISCRPSRRRAPRAGPGRTTGARPTAAGGSRPWYCPTRSCVRCTRLRASRASLLCRLATAVRAEACSCECGVGRTWGGGKRGGGGLRRGRTTRL